MSDFIDRFQIGQISNRTDLTVQICCQIRFEMANPLSLNYSMFTNSANSDGFPFKISDVLWCSIFKDIKTELTNCSKLHDPIWKVKIFLNIGNNVGTLSLSKHRNCIMKKNFNLCNSQERQNTNGGLTIWKLF